MTDTRESLMAAASTLLATEGPEALTVRRIAAEAGCSTMGVYSRFGGKEGVVDALFRSGFEGLHDAMASVEVTDDPMADLQGCCMAYRGFALSHATHYRVMFEAVVPGFEASLESRIVAGATFDALVDRVRRCTDAGLLTGGTPVELAASLWAASHGVVSLEIAGARPVVLRDDDPYARTMDALVRGFSPPTPTPGPVRRTS